MPLLAGPKIVEKTVPMDQRGLLANHAGSLFLAPHNVRKRLAKSTNRSRHPNAMFVGRISSCEHIVAESCVSFVPRGMRHSAFHLAETVHMGLVPVYVCDVYDDVS